MRLSRSTFVGLIVFIISFVLVSPLNSFIGLNSTFIFLVLTIFYFFLNKNYKRPINRNWFILSVILSLILSLSIFLTNSIENYLSSLIFIISVLIAKNLNSHEREAYINISTKFMFLILFGAYIGLMWKILGGVELWNFPNPDGRLNFLFPFTLSNSVWGNLIRPAGIYDEPGAFSFFLCSLAVIRDIFGKNKRITLGILVLGMITLSLAHILFFFIYLLQFVTSIKRFTMIVITSITLLFSTQFISKDSIIYNVFLIRFTINDDGQIHGDNRTKNFIEAFNILRENPKLIISGRKSSNSILVNQIEYGANPLGFILNYGILLSIPYFLMLITFISSIFKSKKYASILGFGFLLMQRDYIYVISYSMVSAMILIGYLYISNKENISNKEK